MEKNNGKEKRARELFAKEVQEEKAKKGWAYNRNLLETSLDSLITIGSDGIITDVNSATEKATGLPREKIIGTCFSEHFTDPEKARVGYKQAFDIGKVVDYELYLKHINGSSIPVSYNASVYKDNEGQIIGMLAVVRDISAIKKYEDEFIDFENNLESIVQQKTAEELVIANKELAFQNDEKEKRAEELVIANRELAFQNDEKEKRAAELVIANTELAFQNDEKEKRAAELVIANTELAFQNDEKEKRAAELVIANTELAFQNDEKEKRAEELVIANTELAFQNDEKEKRAEELVIANRELAFQNDEKEKRAAELLIANRELAFQNDEKEKRAMELDIANTELLIEREKTEDLNKQLESRVTERTAQLESVNKELASQNQEISYISYHDFLTGLYNRAYFEDGKNRLDTPRQLPISIIMGDINGLKLINDGFGHSKGDELLIEISKILKSCCREEDIVSRIGGDEFGILLPKTDSQSAQQICNRIYDTCKGYAVDESSIYPSIALGHATKTIETETLDDIFMAAEESMYRHKLLESKSVHNSIISSIKAIMFEKSQETEEHAERMVELSRSIGLAMSLTEDQLNELELLSTLHDIGKMGMDAKILSKSEELTEEECIEMKKHPEVGFRIAQATSELRPIAEYILCHHERWDGKGYPQGLIGEKIPLLCRIVAIVDSFDAMTNDRVYRSAMTMGEAIEEIKRNSGTQFDPEIARVFVEKVLGQEWEQVNKI